MKDGTALIQELISCGQEKRMTLKEFKKHVAELPADYNDNEVRVVTADGGIGGRTTVGIASVSIGFDWEHGKILIGTDRKTYRNVPDISGIRNNKPYSLKDGYVNIEIRTNSNGNVLMYVGEEFVDIDYPDYPNTRHAIKILAAAIELDNAKK